jgi:hypothetical protein
VFNRNREILVRHRRRRLGNSALAVAGALQRLRGQAFAAFRLGTVFETCRIVRRLIDAVVFFAKIKIRHFLFRRLTELTKDKERMFVLNVMSLSELRPGKSEKRKQQQPNHMCFKSQCAVCVDGHPGSVGVGQDCFHWCSPGPNSVLNTWSDLLARMLTQLHDEGLVS